jgi:hypothetical protein
MAKTRDPLYHMDETPEDFEEQPFAFDSRVSAIATIRGISQYSQSRMHFAPEYENEDPGDYDERTWRQHLHVDEQGRVCVPSKALHEAMITAAQYSGESIPGQGKKTWTAKFASGLIIPENPPLLTWDNGDERTMRTFGVDDAVVRRVDINAHSTGDRKRGKRVRRRYPIISPWQCEFEILIIDPIITCPWFRKFLQISGSHIGIGRYRPENRGSNGRFQVMDIQWNDNREFVREEAA